MSHILVEHDTVKDGGLVEAATWNLLNLGVSLDIDFDGVTVFAVHGADGLDGEVDDELSPSGSELGSDTAVDNVGQILVVFHVNWVLVEGKRYISLAF